MLELFPNAYVDNSLLTAVFLGVLLLWWLAERFGWPATGLVVPGYLGAVLAVRPEAAAVIFVEALLTHLMARSLGEWLPRVLPVDRVFGRDRFFLIILCSIAVRLTLEGGLLGLAGFDLAEGWYSLGLVLVPLTANTLWKPGLVGGIPLLGLPVLGVYILLRFVLLEHTNLSFAEFELTYEDLAWSFENAPRAYVLLLLGALMASASTIRYGWDFGGIIVCGLLAIAWLEPSKLAATLAEVVLVVVLMRGIFGYTPLKVTNLSGLRPIVFAFALAYLSKLLIAWAFQGVWPSYQVGDLFGFGYLLSSIVAVRCWRQGQFARVLLPALAISLVACVGGLALGAMLVGLRGPDVASNVADHLEVQGPARRAVLELLLPPPEWDEGLGEELEPALTALRQRRSWRGPRSQVDAFEDGVVLHGGEHGGVGVVWLRPDGDTLFVTVDRAWEEPALAEAGVSLVTELDGELLALSPTAEVAGRLLDEEPELLRVVPGAADVLRGSLPDSLELGILTELIPGLRTELGEGGAVLQLSPETALRLALRSFDLPVSRGRAALWEDSYPRPSDNEPRGAEELHRLGLIQRGILLPMLEALRRDDSLWLRLSAAHALSLGLEVFDDGEVISLGPSAERAPPRFTLWLRRGGEPTAIELRAAGRYWKGAEVAEAWYQQTRASALLVHDARADLDAEALRRAGPYAPELTLLRGLARQLPALEVISIDVSREDEIPGADGVVSIGRPLADGDLVPPLAERVAGLVEHAGGRAYYYDASEQRQRYYDPMNPRRDAVLAAGGAYVTAYLSPPFRLRFAGTEPGSPLRAMLDHAGIPVGEASLEALLARGEGLDAAGARRAEVGDLLDSLELFTATGHPGALQRFSQDARGCWAFTEASDGLTWLVVDRGDLRLIAPIGLSEASAYFLRTAP